MIKKLSKIGLKTWWVLAVAALMMSISFAYRYVKEEGAKVNRLQRSLLKIKDLSVSTQVRLDELNQVIEGQVVPFSELIPIWLDNGVVTLSDVEVQDLPEGFRHHQLTATLENFPAAEISTLLDTAENARPAWRVTRIDLRPENNMLNGQLTLEALDKSPLAL
ncbi:hypothetical protein P3T73_06275 [Kiritimatiellota bacterium B12222]|nr:hypothetical protein P3T73_06275 [Kiritimatiellota bacterium B12222]